MPTTIYAAREYDEAGAIHGRYAIYAGLGRKKGHSGPHFSLAQTRRLPLPHTYRESGAHDFAIEEALAEVLIYGAIFRAVTQGYTPSSTSRSAQRALGEH